MVTASRFPLRFDDHDEVHERRRQATHPAAKKPELIAELAPERRLRRLELAVTRRLDGLLHGQHLGLLPGIGSEPAGSREYRPGGGRGSPGATGGSPSAGAAPGSSSSRGTGRRPTTSTSA